MEALYFHYLIFKKIFVIIFVEEPKKESKIMIDFDTLGFFVYMDEAEAAAAQEEDNIKNRSIETNLPKEREDTTQKRFSS